MKTILLHVCCGPCSAYCVKLLRQDGFEPVGLFYNPNIHPYAEYLRRRESMLKCAGIMDFEVRCLDDEYAPELYFRGVAGKEWEPKGARCGWCYELRLDRAARYALENGFDTLCSTLFYSRHQDHKLIRRTAEEQAARHGVDLLYRNFRKGWDEGVSLAKAMGLYRQEYCGCLYSELRRYRRTARREE